MTAGTKTFLIALIALLVGGLLGAHFGSSSTYRHLSERSMLIRSTTAATGVGVLQHLRNGETNEATETLEDLVDIELIGVAVDGSYSDATNDAIKKAYSQVKSYRDAYPRKPRASR